MPNAPVLICLPSGLIVSGVATWAARLVNALAERGRLAGLILHAPPPGHGALAVDLHPAVRVFDLSGLPRFEDMAPGQRTPVEIGAAREAWAVAYHDAARSMARDAWGAADGGPVVLSPNLHADCYATCVEVARREPGLVRLVGWQHNDIEYDRRMLAHYEPALAEVVGVSDHIVSLLRTLLPAGRVTAIPYGVEVPEAPPVRGPLLGAGSGTRGPRPVRLLYTGRLDHYQKRILALPHLSAALSDMGIEHELTIMGDGPAAGELDALVGLLSQRRRASAPGVRRERSAVGGVPGPRGRIGVAPPDRVHDAAPDAERACGLSIRRVGAASPALVRRALLEHDAFVLASRFEGLSVSMLEALAAGCVPIVTRVASGALQAVEPGVTGLIAAVGPDAPEEAVGRALADQVAALVAGDARAMSRAAWRLARERFGLEAHVDGAAGVIDRAGSAGAVAWDAGRPVWFGDVGGSVPSDAAARLGRVLAGLGGRRVVVHGTGLHTRVLLPSLLRSDVVVVGFCDDDRQRHAQSLGGLPIVSPSDAAALDATDVVISTWMHEEAVWAGRGVYERQGLVVHRLYGDGAAG